MRMTIQDIFRQGEPGRLSELNPARRDRADQPIDARERIGQRRQALDPLDSGELIGHRPLCGDAGAGRSSAAKP